MKELAWGIIIISVISIILFYSCTVSIPLKSDWEKMGLLDSVKSLKTRYYGLNYQNGEFELTTDFENSDYKFNSLGMIVEETGYLSIKYVDSKRVLMPWRTKKNTFKTNKIIKQTISEHESNLETLSTFKYKQDRLIAKVDSSSNGILRKSKFHYSKKGGLLSITEKSEEKSERTTKVYVKQSKYNSAFEIIEKKEFLDNDLYSIETWDRNNDGYEYTLRKQGETIRKEEYDAKLGKKTNSYYYKGTLNNQKHIFFKDNEIIKQYVEKDNIQEPNLFTYSYDYDDKGNIIEKIEFINGEKSLIETREIEYY